MKYLALGIAMALGCAAYAYPTVIGPTGGYQVPSADTATGWNVSVDRSELGIASIPNTRVQVGVTDNLELGAKYTKFDIDALDQSIAFTGRMETPAMEADLQVWNINAKYALPIDVAGAKIAVGAIYNDISSGLLSNLDLNPWTLYLAGTLSVMEDTKITGTILYSDLDEIADAFDIDDTQTAFAVAAEKQLENGATIGAEYLFNVEDPTLYFDSLEPTLLGILAGKNDLDFGNLYVTYPLAENLTARMALSGIGEATTFSIGGIYTFGAE